MEAGSYSTSRAVLRVSGVGQRRQHHLVLAGPLRTSVKSCWDGLRYLPQPGKTRTEPVRAHCMTSNMKQNCRYNSAEFDNVQQV